MVNIIINNIIEKDHGKKIGEARIRAISISKMMNRIINKKIVLRKVFVLWSLYLFRTQKMSFC